MDEVIKRRTIIDRIRKAYIAECRAEGVEAEAGIAVYLNDNDMPTGLGIDFNELGAILLVIEKDPLYAGRIALEAADSGGNSTSGKGETRYRIRVSHDLFPRGALFDRRPKIFAVNGWWTISMPDKGARPVRIAKKGTLAGELLGILGDTWGVVRKTDAVYDLLEKRVTNKATEGRPDDKQIVNAMKEINKPLNKKELRTIKLVRKNDGLGGTWKFMLDVRPAVSPVGSLKGPKPTKNKKSRGTTRT